MQGKASQTKGSLKNANKQVYYVDSSIIIIMQKIDKIFEKGGNVEDVYTFLMHGKRMTRQSAQNLYKKFLGIKSGEVVFCITPTVYRETMLDANIKDTHDFVKDYCKLVLPNINSARFAELVKTVAKELEVVHSKNGHKGLNPNIKVVNGVKVDDNLEDRLILAEAIAFSILGRKNLSFIDCRRKIATEIQNGKEVVVIGKRYRQSQVGLGRDIPMDYGDDGLVEIFLHSNHNDFGSKLRDNKDVKYVAVKLDEILEKIFSGKSKLKVVTPNEMEKEGC